MTYFLALLLFSAGVSLTQQTHIHGEIRGRQLDNLVQNVLVTARNTTNGIHFGSGLTNAQGLYDFTFDATGVATDVGLPDGYELGNIYPQPFNPSALIEFTTPRTGKYRVGIYSILGKKVFEKEVALEPGVHSLNLSGFGAHGVYLLRILGLDNEVNQTRKLVNLGSGSTPRIEIVSRSTDQQSISKVVSSPDSIDLVIGKVGYETHLVRIPWMAEIAHDDTLDKIPYHVNFDVKPFNVHGELIDTITVMYLTSDSARAFRVDYFSGFIHVNWNDYKENPDTTAKFVQLNVNYSPWIIGRKFMQSPYDKNLYQNGKVPFPQTQLDTAVVSLERLMQPDVVDSSYLYLMPMVHQKTSGAYVTFGDTLWSLLDRRFQPGTEKFVTDTLDLPVFAVNLSTGQPIPQQYVDEMYLVVNDHKSKFVLENGDVLIPHFFTPEVNAIGDSVYQHFAAKNWQNTAVTARENTPTPGNSLQIGPIGEIFSSLSTYPIGENINSITAEAHGTLTTSGDDQFGNASQIYIANGAGFLNETGTALLRFACLADLDTRGYHLRWGQL